MTAKHTVSHVRSGDVDLLVRVFGAGSGVPVVILHGANYYDSLDWCGVASSLARGRQVAVHDARGYGGSDWSSTKDYTHDANVADVIAVMDSLGWERAVLIGASRGGAFAALTAAHFPERVAGLVLLDWIPNTGIRHPGTPIRREQSIGNAPRRFESVEAALKGTTRSPRSISTPAGRERFLSLLDKAGEQFILSKRDPDFENPIPLIPAAWTTSIPVDVDMWSILAAVRAPVHYVKAGTNDPSINPADVIRLRSDFPHFGWTTLDAAHDMVVEAPEALVETLDAFLSERVS